MTKAEQYCYDQGRGELKSIMNQLKECRDKLWIAENMNPLKVEVEQDTKDACFKAADEWYLKHHAGFGRFQDWEKLSLSLKQAIDSVGGK